MQSAVESPIFQPRHPRWTRLQSVLHSSPDPVVFTAFSMDVPAVSTSVSLVRSSKKKTYAPVTPSTPSIVSASVDSSTASVDERLTSSPKKKQRTQQSRVNLSKTSTTEVEATSSSTSPPFLASSDTGSTSPSPTESTATIGLPELAVPYSLQRSRAFQVVA